jgi:hypothetical protein
VDSTREQQGMAVWLLSSAERQTNWSRWAYGGQIYTSTDSGMTWIPRDTSDISRSWPVCCLVSRREQAGLLSSWPEQIYTSTDSGLTWTPREITRALECGGLVS